MQSMLVIVRRMGRNLFMAKVSSIWTESPICLGRILYHFRMSQSPWERQLYIDRAENGISGPTQSPGQRSLNAPKWIGIVVANRWRHTRWCPNHPRTAIYTKVMFFVPKGGHSSRSIFINIAPVVLLYKSTKTLLKLKFNGRLSVRGAYMLQNERRRVVPEKKINPLMNRDHLQLYFLCISTLIRLSVKAELFISGVVV